MCAGGRDLPPLPVGHPVAGGGAAGRAGGPRALRAPADQRQPGPRHHVPRQVAPLQDDVRQRGRQGRCSIELETKVHPKVRNHGGGPY